MHLMTALTGAAVMAMAGVTMGDSLTRLGCDSDITTDGQVDVNDVLDIVGAWGTDAHDTDGDGVCGVNELLQVLQEFGQSCQPFFGNMTVLLDYDQGIALVAGTGLANHPMGPFDGSTGCFNPNTPTAQGDVWQIPLNPVRTNNPGTVLFDTLGPVGVSLNGVAIYNPYDGGGVDAPSTICMDDFNGHPSPDGRYHYHQASPWAYPADSGGHSVLMGYLFDGIPIYGPYESPGVFAKDVSGEMALDDCNGHEDPIRGYHYHAISFDLDQGGFPWIAGCFAAVPDTSNFAGGGGGPPGGCNGCAQNMIPPPVCNCVEMIEPSCCMNWTPACQDLANQFCNGGPP
ncbi:MAG: YHYH protein [Phycisphaerales bacterium]|nr:YHYH protein [Phycisphaerales bacterium]